MPDRNPWQVLISALISTRTRDRVTIEAAARLLSKAPDPKTLAQLTTGSIRRLIYPVGFYRTKAKLLKRLTKEILLHHCGQVPKSRSELLHLPGVGPKVANIVLSRAFQIPVIAVDTHVHRIANRLGLVRTRTPKQTEKKLTQLVPEKLRIDLNPLLVGLGQTICLPRIPKCGQCPLNRFCKKIGVKKAETGRKSPGRRAGKPADKLRSEQGAKAARQ